MEQKIPLALPQKNAAAGSDKEHYYQVRPEHLNKTFGFGVMTNLGEDYASRMKAMRANDPKSASY